MSGSSSGTGTGTGGGTGVSDEVPEERDIAMSMYSQRVRFVIARYYASRAQTCFDLATRNNPELTGEVRIRLTIGADGAVTNATPAANTTGNATLGQCLAGRVRQWRLPPPPGGELTMVLPFRN
jgi:TonB family protein